MKGKFTQWMGVNGKSVSRTALEAEFLAPAESLKSMPFSRPLLQVSGLMILLLCAAFAWAFLGHTDIVVKAPATLITQVRVQQMSVPETARVTAIHVTEGQAVEAGDILFEFDAQAARAELDKTTRQIEASVRQAALAQALIALVNAAVKDGSADMSDVDPTHTASLALLTSHAPYAFHAQHALSAQQQAHADDFLSRLALLDANIRKYESLLPLLETRASDYLRLKQAGYVSQAAWLEREQSYREMQASLADAHKQRHALVARTLREAHDTLTEARRAHAAFEQDRIRAAAFLDRLTVRAPVSGTVQLVSAHTVGAVLAAAQPLLTIVPSAVRLEVQALMANRDAGFVRVGQSARLRLDAYDYTRYGVLDATVLHVSPDAMTDEKQGLVYAVRLQLNPGTALKLAGPLHAGLAGTVDILTGRRRIIDYFLSPFHRTAYESITER